MIDRAHPIRNINVFVHLARGFGRTFWRDRWSAGKILGINHKDPYGYQQASEMGCHVAQSEDQPENTFGRLVRLGIRAALGFDLVHAWRNRHGIFGSDVIWTHTESQALAILALMRLRGSKKRPKLIAQSIWLMDDWASYSRLRRSMCVSLLKSADVLTVHSTSALERLKEIFPDCRCEFVRYGIRADQSFKRDSRPMRRPLRLLALGNDRHRDWRTFVEAVQDSPDVEAQIVTQTDVTKLIQGVTNITLASPDNNVDLMALYGWADLIAVCLTDNLHASGITVIQEAVLCGVPVICSDTGDLRSYFTADEVLYIAPQHSVALKDAIAETYRDQEAARRRSARALLRMKGGNINSYSFVEQHVALSREMLEGHWG